MRAADHLIDLGPGAGVAGGLLMAQGTPADVATNAQSITGRYLSGLDAIPVPPRRTVNPRRAITLEGVTTNNLREVNVSFPLSALICVTGVSGSGKSSLVNETLVARSAPAEWHGAQAGTAPPPDRRQRHRQAGRDRPVADRPHTAQQSGHLYRSV